MGALISLLIFVALLFVAARLRNIYFTLRELSRAMAERKPFLLERDQRASRIFEIASLGNAYNSMLRDWHKAMESERNYLKQAEATLGSIREAVLVIDEENTIRLANESLRALLKQEHDLLGRRLESLFQSADLLDYIRAVKSGQKTNHEEMELLLDKESYWFDISGSQLGASGDDGANLTLFVLHDITQLKRLERMRTEFVANVSHELRTPVTIIKGFADTLLDDYRELEQSDCERFLIKIQRNAERLNQLLEDLLTLSRMEVGHNSLRWETLSAKELVGDIVDNFSSKLNEAGIQLKADLDAGQCLVRVDSIRISQVLNNLMDNALRHAKGCTRVSVTTRCEQDYLWCTVEDDGPGIPAQDLPHIFERFYRVDKGRSRELGGTGLGLSIVKHIIQQHRGEIRAESRPGKGTRILFSLPILPKNT